MAQEKRVPHDPLAIGSNASRRKYLLFAVPVLRTDFQLAEEAISHAATDLSARELLWHLDLLYPAIGVIERAADDEATLEEEHSFRETLQLCKEAAVMDSDFGVASYLRDIQDILVRQDDLKHLPHYIQVARTLSQGAWAGHHAVHAHTLNRAEEEQRTVEAQKELYSRYLTDVFGPVSSIFFSSDWRTDTVVSLARGMYESHDFSGMPILADALQDAGCNSDAILNHCRDTNQVHVRGCWVVDLVLGKQ